MFSPLANVTGHEVPILIPYTNRHCSKMAVSAATFNSFIKYHYWWRMRSGQKFFVKTLNLYAQGKTDTFMGNVAFIAFRRRIPRRYSPPGTVCVKKNDIDY